MKKIIYLLIFLMAIQVNTFAQSLPIAVLQADTFQRVTPFIFGYRLTNPLDTSIYSSAPKITAQQQAKVQKIDSGLIQKYTYKWILYYDFYTTLTGLHNINSIDKADINNVYFYYNIDIKSNLKFMGFKYDTYLFDDYGVRHFFDSITTKTQDQFTFKNSLYYPIYKKKIYASVTANTKTKLFNTYQYRKNAQGEQEKYLYDGFMSPGVIFYSGGITYEAPHDCIIQLGLGTSKVTKIKNQDIFDSRKTEKISGLEKGEKKKSDIGITLTSTVPLQKLNKHFYWEFYENIFAPIKDLKSISAYTFDANNVFHVLLLKYVRLSLRTKLNFNYEQNPKPVIINQLSLGFYLSNHL